MKTRRGIMRRRRFLTSLGLGAGATFLAPIARQLISEAEGQPLPRQRLLLFVTAILDTRSFALEGLDASVRRSDPARTESDYTWPSILSPLEARRGRMLLLDQLHNDMGDEAETNHGLGYGALSCVRPHGRPGRLDPPRSITIDQYLADELSTGAPRKSVLCGLSGDGWSKDEREEMNIFAAGDREPLPHVTDARLLHERLFSAMETDPGQEVRNRLVRDALLADLERLRSRLAGPERERLESYEEAFVDFDARREAAAAQQCETPSIPGPSGAQQEVEAMADLATLALQCGVTNVAAIAVGTSRAHDRHMPQYDGMRRIKVHAGFDGSDEIRDFKEPTEHVFRTHAGLVADALDRLEATPEGDGTALDGTLAVMTTSRGLTINHTHHVSRPFRRFPAIVAGNPRNLNLDGRYIRFEENSHSMADFWRTCCVALGVCPDGFAQGSRNDAGLIETLGAGDRAAC